MVSDFLRFLKLLRVFHDACDMDIPPRLVIADPAIASSASCGLRQFLGRNLDDCTGFAKECPVVKDPGMS